jgi:hypothetical protein
MFPLKKRELIRGFQAHVKAGLGGAADYKANYEDLFLPFDGQVETYYGKQGGNWLRLIRDNGDRIEFAHLSKYLIKPGYHTEGTKAAITGNTGQITTGPHKHIQIVRNGKRLDPETYDWNPKPMIEYPLTIKIRLVINQPQWETILAKTTEIQEWYERFSGNKIRLQFIVSYSNFTDVPFRYYPDGSAIIYETWFDDNVLDPLCDTTILVLRDEDVPDYNPAGKQIARTLGYMGKKPTKTWIGCSENDGLFVEGIKHELSHTLAFFSGFTENGETFGLDWTHKYFLELKQPEGVFTTFDYERIYKTINQPIMAKIIREPNGTMRIVLGNKNIGINSPKLAKIITESGEPIVPEKTSTKQIGVLEEGFVLDTE